MQKIYYCYYYCNKFKNTNIKFEGFHVHRTTQNVIPIIYYEALFISEHSDGHLQAQFDTALTPVFSVCFQLLKTVVRCENNAQIVKTSQ